MSSVYFNKVNVKDIEVANKKVIVRVDFNVPITKDANGKYAVGDERRITEALPTINYLLENNCSVILLSHLSRIKTLDDIKGGKKSLVTVYHHLQKSPTASIQQTFNKLGKIHFCPANRGEEVKKAVNSLKPRDILLLENTRYNDINEKGEVVKLESKCNMDLAKEWAGLGEVFVNDAFGTCHRAHASNAGIAQCLKTSCIGLLIQKELTNLSRLINKPERPYRIIMGGAKLADKLKLMGSLLEIADELLICGGMSFTFFKGLGGNIGTSILDAESVAPTLELYKKYKNKIVLPIDVRCAPSYADQQPTIKEVADPAKVDLGNEMGLDIGPNTIKLFGEKLKGSKTIFWNGPAGVCEFTHFANGTKSICQYLKDLHQKENAFIALGGGDTGASANTLGYGDECFSFVSTGGGAALTFLEGTKLPGLDFIKNK